MDRTKYFGFGWKSIDRSSVGRYSSAKTRRSGSAKAVAVYSIRCVCPTRPQPHVSPMRRRRSATPRSTTAVSVPRSTTPTPTRSGDISPVTPDTENGRRRLKPIGVSGRPPSPARARLRTGTTRNGVNPRATHIPTSTSMPTCIEAGTSRARSAEQQALEARVVECVVEASDEPQGRQARETVALKHESRAHAEENDPHVLDRVIGEQPLQVVLHQRVEHTEQRRNGPQAQHD